MIELIDKIIDSFQFFPLNQTIINPRDVVKNQFSQIPYESLTFGRVIGKGGYATVYQGYFFSVSFLCRTWNGKEVALKSFYPGINYELIQKEVNIQQKIRNKYILPLYGIASYKKDNHTEYTLVLELADYSLDVIVRPNANKCFFLFAFECCVG